MKCGTTSLFSYLAQHPQVAPCVTKEPGYFAEDGKWSQGYEYYENLWKWNKDSHRTALEATANYSKHHVYPQTVERIALTSKERNIQFKFIYVMRDPIKRIESHYIHGLAEGWISPDNPISPHVIDTSRYADQVQKYFNQFPSKDILLLDFDELKSDPSILVKRICKFLDIDASFDFESLGKSYNANKVRIVENPITRKLKSTNIGKFFTSQLSSKQKDLAKSLFGKKANFKFTLNKEQKEYIFNELEEDLVNLHTRHGFDTRHWSIWEKE